MQCPHCLVAFHEQPIQLPIKPDNLDADGNWAAFVCKCASCNRFILQLMLQKVNAAPKTIMVYPKGVTRRPLSSEVPAPFAQDFREAVQVLEISPKASAALSRRCLQHLLREVAKTKKKDLADQIDEVMPALPPHLAEMIDTIRVMGNFAAHPLKSTHTNAIVEVEPEEAEWLLDTLEALFDFYIVQPARTKEKRDKINQKLADAGKPPLK